MPLVEPSRFVTGHPVRADLRAMYDAVRPRFALPVHGSPAHFAAHASLAWELDVEAAVTPVNGGVYEFSERGLAYLGSVPIDWWRSSATALDDGALERQRHDRGPVRGRTQAS